MGVRFIIVLSILLGASSSSAWVRQDLWIPQTQTLKSGSWQLYLQNQFSPQKDTSVVTPRHEGAVGVRWGLYEHGRVGLDAGIQWREPAEDSLLRALYGDLRVRVNEVQDDWWSVSMGVKRLGLVSGKNDINLIYLMLQNRFSQNWFLGVGGFTGSAQLLVGQTETHQNRGILFGVWRQIQSGKGKLAFEFQSGQNTFGYFFSGLILRLKGDVYGTIGYGLANQRNTMTDWALFRLTAEF
jgi:hypothetical protein